MPYLDTLNELTQGQQSDRLGGLVSGPASTYSSLFPGGAENQWGAAFDNTSRYFAQQAAASQPQPTQPADNNWLQQAWQWAFGGGQAQGKPMPAPAPTWQQARQGTPPTNANANQLSHSAAYRSYIDQIAPEYARQAGVDPRVWADTLQALFETENSAPDATSPAGAYGISQAMPNWYEGLDRANPQHQVIAGARALNSKFQAVGANPYAAAGAYFGYGVDAGGQTTGNYQSIWQQHYNRLTGQSPAPGLVMAPAATANGQYNADFVPNQLDGNLDADAAISACGPAAAVAFARATGQNPTLQQALQIAQQVGWTPEGGMNGLANQQALLQRMNIPATVEETPNWQHVNDEIARGHPVIISTEKHYWVLYGAANGRYYAGNSGKVVVGGGEWVTPQEIEQLTGPINGAMFLG